MMKKYFILLAAIMVLIACKRSVIELPTTEAPLAGFGAPKLGAALTDKNDLTSDVTFVTEPGTYSLIFRASAVAKENMSLVLDQKGIMDTVQKFNKSRLGNYQLLPTKYYQIKESVLNKGSITADIDIVINELDGLKEGEFYVLPVKIVAAKDTVIRMLTICKDIEYSAITTFSKKNMPPGAYKCAKRTDPMKMVAYVEMNDWDPRNYGQFLLKNSRKPVFDFIVLFAGGMIWDKTKQRPLVDFGPQFAKMFADPDKYIQSLRKKGIKVLMDILPYHDGVGYANFQSYEEAVEYAQQCKYYSDKYHFDGWDIDEEYADYWNRPERKENDKSFLWFCRAMKQVMPDKLLTAYDYFLPVPENAIDEFGKRPTDYIDYSWSNYGEDHGSLVGLPDHRYGKLSIEASRGGLFSIESSAQANLSGCFGSMMFFNITGYDMQNGTAASSLSAATRLFYGEDCEFVGSFKAK